MLLHDKTAIVYGAAGSLGSAVAKGLSKAGATVFVTGHKLEPVEKLAAEIVGAGGKAVAADVDALDERSVKAGLDALVRKMGTLDVSFNAIGLKDRQNVPLIPETDRMSELFLQINTTLDGYIEDWRDRNQRSS